MRPGDCPDHGPYRLEQVIGETVPSVACGARCTNAVGPVCDCSCGGANHGRGHAAPVQTSIDGHEAPVVTSGGRDSAAAAHGQGCALRLFEPVPGQIAGQSCLQLEPSDSAGWTQTGGQSSRMSRMS